MASEQGLEDRVELPLESWQENPSTTTSSASRPEAVRATEDKLMNVQVIKSRVQGGFSCCSPVSVLSYRRFCRNCLF